MPAANEIVPVDTPIQIQVSKGNEFTMPDLRGKFWTDALPILQNLGWQLGPNNFNKLPDIEGNGAPSASVLIQDPPANTPIRTDGTVTLTFAK